jgi:hypothetical protein
LQNVDAMTAIWKKLSSAVDYFRDSLTEAQYDTLRAVAVIATLGAAGWGAYFLGRPIWLRWEDREALAQAGTFAREKDYQSMLLALRRATESAPDDPTTWRQVVNYLAAIASPGSTLMAREQLVRLAPQDVSVRIALVQEALKAGRYDTANDAMAGFSEAARHDVAFYRLAVAVAVAEGRSNELPARLEKLIAADPTDLNAKFTYAALRLWSPDPLARDAAQAELENLAANRSYRIRAAIELLSDSARRNEPKRLQLLLTWLLSSFAPGVPPDFSAPAVPGWTALVDGIKSAAAAGPASDASLVARWLADMGRRREAMDWLEGLTAAKRNDPIVKDTEAELAAEEQDMTRLDRLLRDGAWGPLPDAARLLGLSAHVETLQFDRARGRALWNDAVAACGDSLAGLRTLVRLAGAWHDADGAEIALRRILDRDPKILWAYDALRNSYTARGDMTDLWQLYGQWVRQVPDDNEIAAQWVLLGCILDKATPEAYARAATLRTGSAFGTLARAAALWRQGNSEGAWSILMGLPAAQLREPSAAFWVAVVAADSNRRGEALQAVADAHSLPLPQEQAELLQVAADKAGNPSR